MDKLRLITVGLFALAGFNAALAASSLFPALNKSSSNSATTTTPPTFTLLPVLSSEDFVKEVNNQNSQTQHGLDTALATLLGTTPPEAPPVQQESKQPPPPKVETPPDNTPPPAATTSQTPAQTGFNPYSY